MNTQSPGQKFKGLINGKEWISGNLECFEKELTAIFNEGKRFFVFKESVSQFTGFINTSGEEIYDGDLLAVDHGREDELNLVFWDEGSQQWALMAHTSGEYNNESLLLDNNLDQVVVGHSFTHVHLVERLPTFKKKSRIFS